MASHLVGWNMYENLLIECGLTQNEALVYLALLRLEKAKSGNIVREAKISGGKIYETLYKLIDKGLVKSVIENGVKHFIANDPKAILEYVKEKEKSLAEKEKELERALPSFSFLRKETEGNENVFFIKGLRGISATVYEMLEKAREIRIMGVRSSKDERYNNFWRAWHRKRVELKKKALILFSDKNTEYWNFFRRLRHTEVREILQFVPSAIMVIDNNLFIFSYENDLVCVHITSHSMARSFSVFFDDLWMFSKGKKVYKHYNSL